MTSLLVALSIAAPPRLTAADLTPHVVGWASKGDRVAYLTHVRAAEGDAEHLDRVRIDLVLVDVGRMATIGRVELGWARDEDGAPDDVATLRRQLDKARKALRIGRYVKAASAKEATLSVESGHLVLVRGKRIQNPWLARPEGLDVLGVLDKSFAPGGRWLAAVVQLGGPEVFTLVVGPPAP